MATHEDPIVEEIHKTREELLRRYGGPEGYARHLQELEEQLGDRVVTRPRREPVVVVKKVS